MFQGVILAPLALLPRPRTRGDVPAVADVGGVPVYSAPHARGCSRTGGSLGWTPRLGPARAGMFRRSAAFRPASAPRPRTRGDVPAMVPVQVPSSASAPHARGCSGRRPRPRRPHLLGPARAGMFRQSLRVSSAPLTRPRTRGDVPAALDAQARTGRSPPHARGCSAERPPSWPTSTLGPARAGMFPPRTSSRPSEPPRPRTRGDVPTPSTSPTWPAPSAPHARGCSGPQGGGLRADALGPVRAGCSCRQAAGGDLGHLGPVRAGMALFPGPVLLGCSCVRHEKNSSCRPRGQAARRSALNLRPAPRRVAAKRQKRQER